MNKVRNTTLFRDRLGFALKPLQGQLIVVEEVVSLVPNLGVVVIHPLQLRIAKQRRLDQVATNGGHRNVFKAQPLLVAELVGCVDLAAHNNVWNICQYVDLVKKTGGLLSMRMPNLPSS